MQPHEPERSRQDVNPISVCVYCGSRRGGNPAHAEAARDTGTIIGRLGWQLVYGGGRAGRVVGVIPQSLMARELGHSGLSELHVVNTMHERKRLMAERSDAFLALPGGIGTLEELFEVWTWRQLGYHDKPVGLLNTDRYYDKLLAFVADMADGGFVMPAQHALLEVDARPQPLLWRLGQLAAGATASDDYSRT
jgi:uncharacterized protein (TIGR00730 family)